MKPDFIQCQAWNKTAEIMHSYLSKGSQIAVEGRIQTRNYEDNTGRKVYVTEVIVDRFEFLESRKNNEDDYEQQSNEIQRQAPELNITSEDLPFSGGKMKADKMFDKLTEGALSVTISRKQLDDYFHEELHKEDIRSNLITI